MSWTTSAQIATADAVNVSNFNLPLFRSKAFSLPEALLAPLANPGLSPLSHRFDALGRRAIEGDVISGDATSASAGEPLDLAVCQNSASHVAALSLLSYAAPDYSFEGVQQHNGPIHFDQSNHRRVSCSISFARSCALCMCQNSLTHLTLSHSPCCGRVSYYRSQWVQSSSVSCTSSERRAQQEILRRASPTSFNDGKKVRTRLSTAHLLAAVLLLLPIAVHCYVCCCYCCCCCCHCC